MLCLVCPLWANEADEQVAIDRFCKIACIGPDLESELERRRSLAAATKAMHADLAARCRSLAP
jgi:hypothetical protein